MWCDQDKMTSCLDNWLRGSDTGSINKNPTQCLFFNLKIRLTVTGYSRDLLHQGHDALATPTLWMLQVTLHVGRATVKVILTACGLHEIQTQDVLALLWTLVSMFSSNQYSKNQTALIQRQKYEKRWKLLEHLQHLYAPLGMGSSRTLRWVADSMWKRSGSSVSHQGRILNCQ